MKVGSVFCKYSAKYLIEFIYFGQLHKELHIAKLPNHAFLCTLWHDKKKLNIQDLKLIMYLSFCHI